MAGSPWSCPATYCSMAPMKLPRCLRPVGWMPEKMTLMRTAQGTRPPGPAGGRSAAVGFASWSRAAGLARLPGSMTVLRFLAYNLTGLVLGPLWFTVLVTGWATGVGLAITLLGLPVVWLTLVAARAMAAAEAGLTRGLLGAEAAAPPRVTGWRLVQRGTAPLIWRAQGFLLLRFALAPLDAAVLLAAWGTAVGLLLAPAWFWTIPGGIDLGLFDVDRLWVAIAVVPLGAVAGVVAVALTLASGRIWRALAERLLPGGAAVAGAGVPPLPLLPSLRTTAGAALAVELGCLVVWAATG